jgi:hypothetical protein
MAARGSAVSARTGWCSMAGRGVWRCDGAGSGWRSRIRFGLKNGYRCRSGRCLCPQDREEGEHSLSPQQSRSIRQNQGRRSVAGCVACSLCPRLVDLSLPGVPVASSRSSSQWRSPAAPPPPGPAALPRELDIDHVLRSFKAPAMRFGISVVAAGAVDDVGEPYAGEPHARLDGRELETGSNHARVSGDWHPRQIAGMSAGSAALLSHLASPLPFGQQAPGAI